jgi:hypothetical protein
MGDHLKKVAIATLAVAGTLAVPAGAVRNAAPVAVKAQDDLTTVAGVRAALANAQSSSANSGQVLAILQTAVQGKSAADVLAIVQAAVQQFPGITTAIVSQVSADRPEMAAQVASTAVTQLAATTSGQAATAAAPAIVRAAAAASGSSTTAIASVVAADAGLPAAELASQADGVDLAGLTGPNVTLGNTTPTGASDEGTAGGDTPGFTGGEFVPAGMGGADTPGAGTPGTGTAEGDSSNAANNNGGGDGNGSGPNASPV